MMKRTVTALLLLTLMFALAAPALADVAYEPRDSFYEKHRQDCDYENRNYYTSGPEGYVSVYGSPTGTVQEALPNGLCFYVSYTYDAGAWGCVEYDPDSHGADYVWENHASGWVKMSEMVNDYDYRSFDADHQKEYTEKEVSLPVPADGSVFCYKYPGSGIVTETLSGDWAKDSLNFSQVFTDPAGREWGFAAYYYAHRYFWVCLDDPSNDALAADENFKAAVTVPAADPAVTDAARDAAKTPALYLYAGAAGLVLIAAAVLFFLLRKKKLS